MEGLISVPEHRCSWRLRFEVNIKDDIVPPEGTLPAIARVPFRLKVIPVHDASVARQRLCCWLELVKDLPSRIAEGTEKNPENHQAGEHQKPNGYQPRRLLL
jgi:hypothetical protein